jgi:hypothetical protein
MKNDSEKDTIEAICSSIKPVKEISLEYSGRSRGRHSRKLVSDDAIYALANTESIRYGMLEIIKINGRNYANADRTRYYIETNYLVDYVPTYEENDKVVMATKVVEDFMKLGPRQPYDGSLATKNEVTSALWAGANRHNHFPYWKQKDKKGDRGFVPYKTATKHLENLYDTSPHYLTPVSTPQKPMEGTTSHDSQDELPLTWTDCNKANVSLKSDNEAGVPDLGYNSYNVESQIQVDFVLGKALSFHENATESLKILRDIISPQVMSDKESRDAVKKAVKDLEDKYPVDPLF